MSSSKSSKNSSSVSEMKREYYEKRDDDRETEMDITNMSKKLSQDLRRDVNRNVKACTFLSEEWMTMVDTIARLGKISSLEATTTRLRSEKKNGREEKEDDIPTLWECGESGIRYLVEDGKMNLLLKVLSDFKESEREMKKKDERRRHLVARYKFELGIGQTFLNAWRHSEVIQIMDVQSLISYIAGIFDTVISDPVQLNEVIESMSTEYDFENSNLLPNSDIERESESEMKSNQSNSDINLAFHYRQEYLVIIYLGKIIELSEETMQEEIGYCMRQHNVLELLVSFIVLLPPSNLKQEQIYEIVKAMNLICSTEDFDIYQNQYLTNDTKSKFKECEKTFISAYAKKVGFQGRKLIRPLLDAINS